MHTKRHNKNVHVHFQRVLKIVKLFCVKLVLRTSMLILEKKKPRVDHCPSRPQADMSSCRRLGRCVTVAVLVKFANNEIPRGDLYVCLVLETHRVEN